MLFVFRCRCCRNVFVQAKSVGMTGNWGVLQGFRVKCLIGKVRLFPEVFECP